MSSSSYRIAQLNHFSPAHLAATLAAAGDAKPLFVYTALMLPKALSLLLNGELTPMELAMMMTPVVLGGYERLKVKGAEFPAAVVVEGLTPSSSSSALPTASGSGSASGSAANAFAHVGASSTFGTAMAAHPFAPLSPATADVTGMLILGLTAPQRKRIDDEES